MDHRMTPSEQAKAVGLKSLAEVARLIKKPVQTLHNWHRDAPELFEVVIAGAVVVKKGRGENMVDRTSKTAV